MATTARERLARLLDGSGPAGAFSAQLSASAQALAEVQETRDANPSGGGRANYDNDCYEFEHDDGADPIDFELNDLIDDEIILGWWTDPGCSGGEPISLNVRDHEVGATTPTVELDPHRSSCASRTKVPASTSCRVSRGRSRWSADQ